MSHTTITFLVLGAVVVIFVIDKLPVAVVALGVALSLWATGVLPLNAALAGFGDPAVVFIAALFVVSSSLDGTGVTTWAGELLISRVGESRAPARCLDAAARRRRHGADQRERRGRRPPAGDGGHGGSPAPPAVAAPDAARLRRARRVAAHPDRLPRERGRLRVRARSRRRRLRVLLVRARRDPPRRGDGRRRRAARTEAPPEPRAPLELPRLLCPPQDPCRPVRPRQRAAGAHQARRCRRGR